MNIRNVIEDFVAKRQERDQIEIRRKEIDEELAELTATLVGWIEMNPVATLESLAGFRLSKGTRRSADIVDYRALEEWALTEGDEYVKERWGLLNQAYKMKDVRSEVFTSQPNRRLLTVLLKHYAHLAETTGRDMNDLLPPGLKQRATTYIIMRRPSKKAQKRAELEDAGAGLVKMAREGAEKYG